MNPTKPPASGARRSAPPQSPAIPCLPLSKKEDSVNANYPSPTQQEIDAALRELREAREKKEPARCGVSTLAPNDLILPCILPKGHDGYHDTGRR
jgi:hypothetical protein